MHEEDTSTGTAGAQTAATAHLQEDVDLGSGLIEGFLHRNRHSVYQLSQLQLLFLPDYDILELITQSKQPQQLDVAHGWLQVLIVGCNGVVSHIVVTGNATQISHLQAASAFSTA